MSYSSHWEEDYAKHLDVLRASGQIREFHYEPFRILLADKCTYLPDFVVVPADPAAPVEVHEVKGFPREDAIIKFKVAAAKLTYMVFIMVKKEKGGGWKEIMRFNDGVRSPVAKTAPVPKAKKAVPIPPVKKLSYAEMQRDPELVKVMKLSCAALRKLRGQHDLEVMAELVGTSPHAWKNLEDGVTKLYHYRHVLAVKKLMDEGF
ncbi:MAG TPA: hypothetical protein PL124_12300 [Candidatus Cloacimonadota bacterium]|nr:hypothetical protein [Candidatus Cloacimonadota bacterium]HPS40191.1 hypothetical protein [Candidatus Cloacimonadota bacterium]